MDRTACDDSDAVLAAALALIDDVYGSSDADGECEKLRRRRFSRQQEETVTLRVRANKLEQVLDALRGQCTFGDTAEMTRVWAQVACRQRRQREEAVAANVLMKQAIQDQQELLVKTLQLLMDSQTQLQVYALVPPPLESRRKPLNKDVPLQLQFRLDRVRDYYLSQQPQQRIPFPGQNDYTLQFRVARGRLHVHLRFAAVYPFKLSSVAHEFWKLANEDSLGNVTGRLEEDNQLYTAYLNMSKPFGRMEFEGPTAVQRMYLPDGSVLIMSMFSTIGALTLGNVLAGFEVHETEWTCVRRLDAANPRSPVVVEMVNQVQIHLPATESPWTMSHAELRTRLERAKDFLERTGDRNGVRTRQVLENRLLASSH